MDYSQYGYVPPEDFIYKPNKKIMSDKPKRYRLKKDTPEVKAGAIYKYNDVYGLYVLEVAEVKESVTGVRFFHSCAANAVEGNTEWFEEVVEKFQVIGVNKPKHSYGFYIDYIMRVTQEIPSEKIPAIKEAIERVLNNEMVFEFIPINVKYTKDQLRLAEQNAFNQARIYTNDHFPITENVITGYLGHPLKYKTFEDYKKHNP